MPSHYRRDIDGLRGFAIILVLCYHAFPELVPHGFLGVDIFFVISGYLITQIIVHDLHSSRFNLLSFYIRRIKRILPVYVLVLVSVSLLASFTLYAAYFKNYTESLKAAAGMYINFQLMHGDGYFNLNSAFKPLLHFWSLAIEEQFYLIWPPLLLLFFRLTKWRPVFKLFALPFFTLSFATSLYFFFDLDLNSYYSPLARAWQLLLGCGIALKPMNSAEQQFFSRLRFRTSPYAPTLLLLLGLFFPNREFAALIVCCATAWLIVSGEKNSVNSMWNHRWIVQVGLISYSLYLWHWPLLSFLRIQYHPYVPLSATLITLFLAVLLSLLTYCFIERPLKTKKWDTPQIHLPTLLKPASLLFILLCIFMGAAQLPKFTRDEDRFGFDNDYFESKKFIKTCLSDADLVGRLKDVFCLTDSKNQLTRGLILGDSHARALFPGVVENIPDVNWQLVSYQGCAPFFAANVQPDACERLYITALQKFKSLSEFKYVIIVMSQRVFDMQPEFFNKSENIESIVAELQQLTQAGKHLIITLPAPEIAENVMACLKKEIPFIHGDFVLPESCRVSLKKWRERSAAFTRFTEELKKRIPQITLIDPTTTICEHDQCSVVRRDKLLYTDYDHLSYYGSGLVALEIKKIIR